MATTKKKITPFEALYLIDYFQNQLEKKYKVEKGTNRLLLEPGAKTAMFHGFMEVEREHPNWTYDDFINYINEVTLPKVREDINEKS